MVPQLPLPTSSRADFFFCSRVATVIGAPLSDSWKKNTFQDDNIWGKHFGATAEAPQQSQSGDDENEDLDEDDGAI